MATESRQATSEPDPAAPASGLHQQPPTNDEVMDVDTNTNQEAGTASPPLPEKHVALTPGPRATRLRDLHAQALDHTLTRLGWDNFAACFPTVARRAEPVLRQVQAQMVAKLGDKCAAEFDNILAQRAVVAKLNELEGLVADATSRRIAAAEADEPDDPTPPHALPPDRILAAHLAPATATHRAHLSSSLEALRTQNALLRDRAADQRAEAARLVARLEAAVADARGANAALRPIVDQLTAEARESRAALAEIETEPTGADSRT